MISFSMGYTNHFPGLIANLTVTSTLLFFLLLSLNVIGHVSSSQTPGPSHAGDDTSLRNSEANLTQGRWEILQQTIGVVAMHMAVTRFNTVIMFDQTGSGPSRYRLPQPLGGVVVSAGSNGTAPTAACLADTVDPNCFAHSVEYDVATNQLRPLWLDSDPWFSSGAFLNNGTLLTAGGYGEGARQVRRFTPCKGGGECDWREDKDAGGQLAEDRWYSAAVLLPEREDRVMVVGGKNAFNYEFLPKRTEGETSFTLPLLRSGDSGRPSSRTNLYPFVHLSSDGNLFIFAIRDSILFDYRLNRVVRTFPQIPGTGFRTYPSTGSSVLLPLDHSNHFQRSEVMICGGAAPGAYHSARRLRSFSPALGTCGRIVISSPSGNSTAAPAVWRMERMPAGRVMGDMIVLPTGEVLIINGAERGAAGWDSGRRWSRRPFLYSPRRPRGQRFSLLRPTNIPRMYRSAAVLLADGRVLVGGSNPHSTYRYESVYYPTELRLQAFVPHYMEPHYDDRRPMNVSIRYNGGAVARYGEEFVVTFRLGSHPSDDLEFVVYAPPFASHSASANQRMLRLRAISVVGTSDSLISAILVAPPNANVAPSGYYMLTVLNGNIPSLSKWVRFTHT